MRSRLFYLSLCLCCSITMLAWLLYSQLSVDRSSRDNAALNLRQMRATVDEIQYLRSLSRTAYIAGEQPKQAIQPWLDCAKRAGFERQLTDFSGSHLTPIPNTDFSQEQVFVRLERVSTRQIFQFLSIANDSQPEYVPTSIEMQSLPKATRESQEIWNANLILTRLVFTAINRPR